MRASVGEVLVLVVLVVVEGGRSGEGVGVGEGGSEQQPPEITLSDRSAFGQGFLKEDD